MTAPVFLFQVSRDRGRWRPSRYGRRRCSWCGRTVALTAASRLQQHGGPGGAGTCPGGGL